jgi:hypothetical protein
MRVRGLWDVAALPRADIAKVAEQKGVMCNPLHLKERNNSEIPDTIDINGENTIVRFKAKVVE